MYLQWFFSQLYTAAPPWFERRGTLGNKYWPMIATPSSDTSAGQSGTARAIPKAEKDWRRRKPQAARKLLSVSMFERTLQNKHWPRHIRFDPNLKTLNGLEWLSEDPNDIVVAGLVQVIYLLFLRNWHLIRCLPLLPDAQYSCLVGIRPSFESLAVLCITL